MLVKAHRRHTDKSERSRSESMETITEQMRQNCYLMRMFPNLSKTRFVPKYLSDVAWAVTVAKVCIQNELAPVMKCSNARNIRRITILSATEEAQVASIR